MLGFTVYKAKLNPNCHKYLVGQSEGLLSFLQQQDCNNILLMCILWSIFVLDLEVMKQA